MKREPLLLMAALLLAAAPASATKICQQPQANINPGNQTVPEASVVNGARVPTVVGLDATNSNPKNGVTCLWTDPTNQVVIVNPTSCSASFRAPDVGSQGQNFDIQLKVTSTEDGCTNLSDTKSTRITITDVIATNRAPVAAAIVAGATAPYSVNEGAVVTLDASGSSDPDGDPLTYTWRQVIDPNNPTTSVALDSQGPLAHFTAPPERYPNGETLRFELTVSDGSLRSSIEIPVSIRSVNESPVARVSCPESVNEGACIMLDGAGSSDPDAGPLSYQWSQIHGIPNANFASTDLLASSISFTAPSLTAPGSDTMKLGLTVTDNGNLYSYADCDVRILDITPPVISTTEDITREATSAAGADATYNPTAHDAFYGDVSVTCVPTSGSTFALDQQTEVKCEASDLASPPNTAKASFKVNVVDTTPPVLTLPELIGPLEGNTLGGAAVTYATSALDMVDGPVKVTCDKASGSVFPVGTTKVTCSAVDAHTNKKEGTINVIVTDQTPPVITFDGGIGNGDSFYFGSVPPVPGCKAADIVSGNVECKVEGYSPLVGQHTLKATATDAAGNKAEKMITFTVQPWTLKGFYNPVDMSGTTNTVKGGSTVPLKFEVFSGGTELTATSSISSIQTQAISCTSLTGSADQPPIDALATGGTGLRYDGTSGQFMYNWQTPKSPGTCYMVTATTLDGSNISANFKLK